jgi:outer membrane protein assembly factor BamB
VTPNPRDIVQEYQSPMPMTLDGRDMILATGRQGYLIGVDARTGKQLWEYTGFPQVGWHIPSPLPVGDGRIFMTGGYGAGCVMLKVERHGDQYSVSELYRNNSMGSTCAEPLLWDGHLYGNSHDVGGGLRCLTLDGRVEWDSRKNHGPTFDLGTLLIADGLIYAINGQSGDITMAEAAPDGYRQLATSPLLAPPEDWAPLAYEDGKLLARDSQKLYCLDLTVGK